MRSGSSPFGRTKIRGTLTENDKAQGKSVVPPTVPIRNVNVPNPTTGSEPESKDVVRDAESKPDDPDQAAKDGLA
jgi:hypothetical protein